MDKASVPTSLILAVALVASAGILHHGLGLLTAQVSELARRDTFRITMPQGIRVDPGTIAVRMEGGSPLPLELRNNGSQFHVYLHPGRGSTIPVELLTDRKDPVQV